MSGSLPVFDHRDEGGRAMPGTIVEKTRRMLAHLEGKAPPAATALLDEASRISLPSYASGGKDSAVQHIFERVMTLENMSRCGFPGDGRRFPAIGLHKRATGVKFATARDI